MARNWVRLCGQEMKSYGRSGFRALEYGNGRRYRGYSLFRFWLKRSQDRRVAGSDMRRQRCYAVIGMRTPTVGSNVHTASAPRARWTDRERSQSRVKLAKMPRL